MIGRAGDVEEIAAALAQGTNVVLAEPRRTGKTSVCEAAVDLLRRDGFYTASVDLFLISDIDQLAEALVEQVFANRPLLRKALHAAKAKGVAVYDAVSLSATVRVPNELEGIDFTVLPRVRHDPVAYLDYALALPEKIAVADERRLVLFVDEFQDVDRIGDNHGRGWSDELKRRMRAVFQRAPHVSFLFAGSLDHMMRTLFGDSGEPFYNFGAFHDLGPITAEEWLVGLARKFRQAGVAIDDDALVLVVERGRLHPRATMLIAQRAHLVAALARVDRIDVGLVEAAYLDALRVERPKHDAQVERIQRLGKAAVNRVALRALVAIARGEPPYAGARYPAEIARALTALRDAGFVESRGRSRWEIADPLFAAYLAQLDIPEPGSR
jgi:uncharacterized protein